MRLEQPVGGVYEDPLRRLQTLSLVYFIISPVREVVTPKTWHFVLAKFVEWSLELVWLSVVVILRLD